MSPLSATIAAGYFNHCAIVTQAGGFTNAPFYWKVLVESDSIRILGLDCTDSGVPASVWVSVLEDGKRHVWEAQEYGLPLLERGYLAQTVFRGRVFYISHVVQPAFRITRSLQSLAGSLFSSGGTERVCRAAFGQPRNRGGFAFPSMSVRFRLHPLQFLLRLLHGIQCSARDIAAIS